MQKLPKKIELDIEDINAVSNVILFKIITIGLAPAGGWIEFVIIMSDAVSPTAIPRKIYEEPKK